MGVLVDRKADSKFYFFNENTGITCIDITAKGGWVLKFLNDYQHLEDYNLSKDLQQISLNYGGLKNKEDKFISGKDLC